MTLIESTIRVWQPPTSRRRFRTKHAAFVAWAKDLMRARECGCSSSYDIYGPGPYTCPWHESLFTAATFCCDQCGSPAEPGDAKGCACDTCERGGRCTVPGRVPSNTRYLRLRNRLARWLKWRSALDAATNTAPRPAGLRRRTQEETR